MLKKRCRATVIAYLLFTSCNAIYTQTQEAEAMLETVTVEASEAADRQYVRTAASLASRMHYSE